MRTSVALQVMREMAQVPGAIVGAGTVLNPKQLDQAMEAGAQFLVSPGLTKPSGKAAVTSGTAYLPGTATAGALTRGTAMGLARFTFLPADTYGSIRAEEHSAGPECLTE